MSVAQSFEMGRAAAGGGKVSGVSKGLDIAFQAWLQNVAQKRQAKMEQQRLATAAVYEDDPRQAYGVLGLEAPKDQTASTPSGMKPTRTTIQRGKTQTTYEAPAQIDLERLMTLYGSWRAKVESQQELYSTFSPKFKPKPIKDFQTWIKETGFGKLLDENMKGLQDLESVEQPDIGEEEIKTSGKLKIGGRKPAVSSYRSNGQAKPKQSDTVNMKRPDGQTVPVHKSRLKEAKDLGFIEVK